MKDLFLHSHPLLEKKALLGNEHTIVNRKDREIALANRQFEDAFYELVNTVRFSNDLKLLQLQINNIIKKHHIKYQFNEDIDLYNEEE